MSSHCVGCWRVQNSIINGHWDSAKIHVGLDSHVKLNPGLLWQKNNLKAVDFFIGKLVANLKKNLLKCSIWSAVLYGFETWKFWKFWNVVFEKDGEADLDRRCEKWTSITGSREEGKTLHKIKRRKAYRILHNLLCRSMCLSVCLHEKNLGSPNGRVFIKFYICVFFENL